MNSFIIQVNGRQYSGLKSGNVKVSMQALSGEFTVVVSKPRATDFPIKRGAKVVILVNNTPLLTGYVTKISTRKTAEDHEITVSGRDKTCDIVDNTLPAGITFKTGSSIVDIAKKILDTFKITDIQVKNTVKDLQPFTNNDIVASETAENAFDFLEKYCKKLKVLISTDGLGNIVFCRANTEMVDDFINVDSGINKGSIKSIEMETDESELYHYYIINSQDNVSTDVVIDSFQKEPPNIATNRTATFVDDKIRPTRFLYFTKETSENDQEKLLDHVKWEAGVRISKAFKYTVITQGFVNSKKQLWRPNMLISVTDAGNDVSANLLILSATFAISNDGGTETTLELTTQEAFTVLNNRNKNKREDKKKNKTGNNNDYVVNEF